MKTILIGFLPIFVFQISSCTNEGYPNIQFYHFSVSKQVAEKDLLKSIAANTNTIPSKWKEYCVPFDFMDDKLVYFKSGPEEVLRIGFTGDSTQWNSSNKCRLSLYGLFQGDKWQFSYDMSNEEKERIKKRLETEILVVMRHTYKKED